ncbi:MAG: efflux RND transporter periplasmic adaptor subunit [Verrucomicrobia bacterium]|nr:efflux RND transporter periplasmic adaptor subunit [Verrucomicrobiota bacterium]MDA1085715.1 efflux RND transporter periplasmic adaptor subunit [Verrucomicrobiota bacterium]
MKVNKKKMIMIVAAALLIGSIIGRGCSGHRSADIESRHAGDQEAKVKFWTCSMHPEIQLPEPGKCPKCGMNLIPVMASHEADDAPMSLRELKLSRTAQALADVETSPVERRFATAEIRMVGKVDYDETKLAYLTAWVPGRLDRLYVDYTGVEVKKGDHMVSIYSPELLAAQEELIQAVKTVESLKGSDSPLVKDRTADTVVSSREKLRLWGLTEEQIKGIEKRGTPDDHLTIYSPISGIVIHKNALEGGYVTTGTRIYTIADLSQVWVKLDAYESDLSWIRYGQDMEFETESYPGRTFRGTIAFIDPVLNEKTRTVKVRVNVDNRSGDLKPGMFVRATVRANISTGGRVFSSELAGKWISPMHPEIVKSAPGDCDICGMPLVSAESLGYVLGDSEEAPLVIPVSAALITGRRAIVYVMSPDRPGVFEGREIVLGPRAGHYYLVRRGLSEGERVVTKGAFKLDAELQIYAKPSMMTPEGGGGGGGHDHGGSKPAMGNNPEDQSGMTGMTLSALTQSQLHDVLSATQAADDSVGSGDLKDIHAAFAALSDRVEAVTVEEMSGHLALLWKEYAMLLGNDGLEGSTIETLTGAKHLAEALRGHAASMRRKMDPAHGRHVEPNSTVNPEFLAQFGGVVNGYIELQGALAADDFAKATANARDALAALSSVDMTLLTGGDHMAWMAQADALKSMISKVAQADALSASRVALAPLSEQIMAAAKRFGAPSGPLYQFKCPMALGGEGATWIQNDKDTRNPYFGEAMLGCGEIREVLGGRW